MQILFFFRNYPKSTKSLQIVLMLQSFLKIISLPYFQFNSLFPNNYYFLEEAGNEICFTSTCNFGPFDKALSSFIFPSSPSIASLNIWSNLFLFEDFWSPLSTSVPLLFLTSFMIVNVVSYNSFGCNWHYKTVYINATVHININTCISL